MAYLYTAGMHVKDSANVDLFSDVVFVDLENGAYQANSVDLSGVKAWLLANTGSAPVSSAIQFMGYVPTRGSIWYYGGYMFAVPVNPKPSIPATSAYSVINPTTPRVIGTCLGVDESGIYSMDDSNSGTLTRIGYDGSLNASAIDTPFTRGPLGCPLLWRNGGAYRAFGQVGTGFSSSQRGATTEFTSPGNASGLDGTRSATGVGANRGSPFAGYFNGYQPVAGADTTTQGAGFFRAENQSPTSCDLKGAWFSTSTGLSRVYMATTHVLYDGSAFYVDSIDVGSIFEMESLVAAQFATDGRTYQFAGVGGVQAIGLFADVPPWEPDAPGEVPQFWMNVVQATESV